MTREELGDRIQTVEGLMGEAKRIASGKGDDIPAVHQRAILRAAIDLGGRLVVVADLAAQVSKAIEALAAEGVYLAHLADLAEPAHELRLALNSAARMSSRWEVRRG